MPSHRYAPPYLYNPYYNPGTARPVQQPRQMAPTPYRVPQNPYNPYNPYNRNNPTPYGYSPYEYDTQYTAPYRYGNNRGYVYPDMQNNFYPPTDNDQSYFYNYGTNNNSGSGLDNTDSYDVAR